MFQKGAIYFDLYTTRTEAHLHRKSQSCPMSIYDKKNTYFHEENFWERLDYVGHNYSCTLTLQICHLICLTHVYLNFYVSQ